MAHAKWSELGGVAQRRLHTGDCFFVIMFATVSPPITNAFIGEYLMLNGIFNSTVTSYGVIYAVVASTGVILSVVYMFSMARKVFLGNTNELTVKGTDIDFPEKAVLGIILVIILVMGCIPTFPQYDGRGIGSLLKVSDIQHLILKNKYF